MTLVDTYIQNGLQSYLDAIITTCKEELIQQGHKVTGGTENSFVGIVTQTGETTWTGVIKVKESAVILNYGVAANRVPYGGGGGRGGKSLYIEELINWAAKVRPDLGQKERKSFVFAVAKKASKEGHPTVGSYRFSKNGRRKDWIEYGVKVSQDNLRDFLNPKKIFELLVLQNGLG